MPGLSLQKAITIAALPLTLVGFVAEDNWLVVGVFTLAALLIGISVYTRTGIPLWARIALCLVVFLLFGGFAFLVSKQNLKRELEKNFGVLIPASDIAPVNPTCREFQQPPLGVLAVHLGSNTTIVTLFPFVLIKMNGDPVLEIDRGRDGLIIRTLKLMDDRQTVIAKIGPNGFWANPEVRRERPDRSTLVIYDHLDKLALRIRFLNPQFLSVEGVFRDATGLSLTITRTKTYTGNNAASRNNCFIDGWENVTPAGMEIGVPPAPK